MYLLIIILPLLSSFITGLLNNFLSKQGAILLSLMLMLWVALLSFFIFYEIILSNSVCSLKLYTWFESNIFYVDWGFLFDNLTATMLVVITFVSFLVHFYSISYMSEDPHLCRFMSYLSLFTFFMLVLVTADNFIQMFLGWEGVGLASYLLINFWYTRIEANKAAMKAIILNRVGDLGLSLGIAVIFLSCKSVEFPVIFALTPSIAHESIYLGGYLVNKVSLIGFFVFIGAVGKSAQIGLHTWLPDAMEGPTPVSALIHAATMVTAGVFVLLRCSPLLEYTENVLLIIAIIGGLTAFMAATIGVVQNDLKKVIAYSTCSQLGYMVFSIGLSNYSVSLFHLMNHAFFKALLFLSAGSIIHAMADEQDMRKMGGLIHIAPVTYVMVFIGSLSLMGFPFLTGFYSKDVLLELAFGNFTSSSIFIYWLGVISAFFTSFYSIRLLYLTFLTRTNSVKPVITHAHEGGWILLIPLLFLFIGSVFWGFFSNELFLGLNIQTWNNVFFVHPWHNFQVTSEFLPVLVKLLPVVCSCFGGGLSFLFYKFIQFFLPLNQIYYFLFWIYHFLQTKWYFDSIYLKLIVKPVLHFGYFISFKLLDRGLIERFGPLGVVQFIRSMAFQISALQTGLIYNYILLMLLGLTLFLLLCILPNFLNIIFCQLYFYIFLITRVSKA